jgi:hypothetical protein
MKLAKRHTAVLTEWDEFVSMIGIYDSMQTFCFDGRNILNGQLWKNRICVSKYRFLGSQPVLYKERERSTRGFIDYIRKLRTTITINGIQ